MIATHDAYLSAVIDRHFTVTLKVYTVYVCACVSRVCMYV